MMNSSKINPIEQLVNQGSSRYALSRTNNQIVEYSDSEVYSYPWKCEIPESEGDTYLYINSPTRPDQLAASYYGDPKLWWIIAQVNNLISPLTELKIGSTIRIPTYTKVVQSGVTR